jgi:hypothetical protein
LPLPSLATAFGDCATRVVIARPLGQECKNTAGITIFYGAVCNVQHEPHVLGTAAWVLELLDRLRQGGSVIAGLENRPDDSVHILAQTEMRGGSHVE